MSFSLVVGTEDVTSYVRNGATFSEVASSPAGQALLTLTGAHAESVVGASVTLTASGVLAWEGTVASVSQQTDPQTGFVLATLISAVPLSAKFDVAAQYTLTEPTDGAQVASALAAIPGVPWSGPANYGVAVGALNVSRLSDGVSATAAIVGRTWSVRNGSLQFVGATDAAPAALATVFAVAPQTAQAIHVTGGIDAVSRQALQGSAQPAGAPSGPVYHLAAPMLADAPTLSAYATAVAERYAPGAVAGTATLPIGAPVVRAGDFVVDQNGVATVAHAIRTTLTAGQYVTSLTLGYPPLGTTPAYDSALYQAATQYPVARLHDGYVVQGGDLTATGLSGSLDALTMVLGGQSVTIASGPLTLPANATFAVIATGTGYVVDLDPTTPFPGEALALWAVTTDASGIVGQIDLRTHGSVGISNVQSNTYAAPTTSSPSGDAVDGISGLTTDVTVTATFSNIPGENTAAKVAWYFRTAGGTAWSLWGSTVIPGLPQPAASQTLTFDFTALPNGGAFDFGAAYEGLRGDTGPIAVVLADFATGALAVPSGDGPPMPSTVKTNGPDVTSSSLGSAAGLGAGSFAQPFSLAVGDWTAGNNPTWFVELLFYKRQHGDTNAIPVGAITANTTGLTYASVADLPASATGWDIGVAYLDASGQASAIVWPAALNAVGSPLQPPAIATGTYVAPTVSSASSVVEGTSAVACDVIVTAAFSNLPGAPANGVQWYVRATGTTQWALRGITALSATSFKFASLVNGGTYDFGAAYVGVRHDDTGPVAAILTGILASVIAVPSTGLPAMPVGATISATSVAVNVFDGGMVTIL